ncbi:MAG: hypothetical protein HOV94_15230, partial [Saccharothrix sp.]|nr:hypothetical protein [Saccharothrix sp.]
MQIEVFRVSRKPTALPVAVVLAALALTGCEHPDGMALIAASSARAPTHTTPRPDTDASTATTSDQTTTTATAEPSPPAATTTDATTEPPAAPTPTPA